MVHYSPYDPHGEVHPGPLVTGTQLFFYLQWVVIHCVSSRSAFSLSDLLQRRLTCSLSFFLFPDNGFWDTFRTVYPLLSLIYPDHLGNIVQGIPFVLFFLCIL